jgi:hypothetical protein
MGKKLTKDEFIKRAVLIHQDKYSYDSVVYVNNYTKVKIYCKACQKYFEQTPKKHLEGYGCQECGKKYFSETYKYTREQFEEKARKIHHNKYNYKDVEYTGIFNNVKIFCNDCQKTFIQTPHSHLAGHGCPYCHNKNTSERCRSNTDEFIQKATKLFGNTFDYSLVKYETNLKKVKIICNTCHREFEQRPTNHLSGYGCPYCKSSKGELVVKQFLEDHSIEYIRQKRFNNCKDLKPLPFDFYLPTKNICIEYQGEQHFNKRFYYGKYKDEILAEEAFNKQCSHDNIKREYCKINGIKLLTINYNDDIIERLSKEMIGAKQ